MLETELQVEPLDVGDGAAGGVSRCWRRSCRWSLSMLEMELQVESLDVGDGAAGGASRCWG
ncbi:hypothetical protein scyTo_0020966, partial [Scyliorhinus torazame]|nr:hypothetical protein [Scyliorhinus torazame]